MILKALDGGGCTLIQGTHTYDPVTMVHRMGADS